MSIHLVPNAQKDAGGYRKTDSGSDTDADPHATPAWHIPPPAYHTLSNTDADPHVTSQSEASHVVRIRDSELTP